MAFDFLDVVEMARARAAKAYKPPAVAPSFLTKLTYDEYRRIRFHPEQSLWRDSGSKFQAMLIAPGSFYRHLVDIHVVDEAGVHEVPFRKQAFSWASDELAAKVPEDLGHAGFKLTYPLNGPKLQDQFLVFVGASYFRGVARGQRFGLSARGIAIDTGLASGEEFPVFTDFWLVRPPPNAHAMRFYALLDGPSVTGAYRFIVFPGDPTRLDVRVELFVRQDIKLLGLAPLTSMFFYGRNTPRPTGMWRGAVHDSNGLLIHAGTGEWLWHPLANPVKLAMEYFQIDSVRGFGLMQRERDFRVYQDAEARYDRRPSAWVEPQGDWGKGHVVLVKIPTESEVNDNIVAFWSPSGPARAGDHYAFDYTLSFGDADMTDQRLAIAESTFVGRADKAGRYRFIVDFGGGPLVGMPPETPVKAVVSPLDGAEIIYQHVELVEPSGAWRLSLVVQAPKGRNLNLRAYLGVDDRTLTETWTYTLPPVNRMTKQSG